MNTEPYEPGDAVEPTRGHVDLHVVAVVEADGGHVVHVLPVEGEEGGGEGGLGGGAPHGQPQGEGQEGGEYGEEGGEVVEGLGGGGVHCVEHHRPHPRVYGGQAVEHPHLEEATAGPKDKLGFRCAGISSSV